MKYILIILYALLPTLVCASTCGDEMHEIDESLVTYKTNHKDLINYSKKLNWLPNQFKTAYVKSSKTVTQNALKNKGVLRKNNCSLSISRSNIEFLHYSIKLDRITYYHLMELNSDTTLNDKEKLDTFNDLQEDSIDELKAKFL